MSGIGEAAAIIGVATAAYQSARTLYELVKGYQKAPQWLKDTQDDLKNVQHVLRSIRDAMEDTTDDALSDGMKRCLRDLKPTIEGCQRSCDEFVTWLEGKSRIGLTLSKTFSKEEIVSFKSRIGSYKSTLGVNLDLITFKSTDQNSKEVRQAGAQIITAISTISGRLQGLEIGAQTVADLLQRSIDSHDAALATQGSFDFASQRDQMLQAMAYHSQQMAQCLQACTSALDELENRSSSVREQVALVGNAQAVRDGRVMLAVTIGKDVKASSGPARQVATTMRAEDHGYIVGADAVSDEFAKSFFPTRERNTQPQEQQGREQ